MKKCNTFLYCCIIAITLAFFAALGAHGQSVIRNGKTFIEQVDSTKRRAVKEPTKTEYTYVDKNGTSYPIYLSSNGKAFIVRTSKRTGKAYRQYLPEITKQLNKK